MKLVEGTVDVDDVDAFVAAIDEIASSTDTTIQAFDARYVVSERHLERAVELADRAFERGENVARDRAVEILLYAAGRRQITNALELGVSPGANRVVVLVDAGEADPGDGPARNERAAAEAIRDRVLDDVGATLGDYDPERVREYFDVSDAELDVVDGDLESLVLERAALLVVEK
ncbi:KEOPS complex subunit Cgi121 [Halobellus limi]|uniref:KEOPS complex component n=1 Tax=Halobellus limi TaxID=699433 RepID=A0A1H5X1Q6_9EURY|nr:KEOPS complex subunit Cgi121 [Halobellus limi]QCC48795.1 KEOPS complex component [Halobellus limi]SEG05829.1 KEOPS complex subunit Cgi121 [Halobellus limi]